MPKAFDFLAIAVCFGVRAGFVRSGSRLKTKTMKFHKNVLCITIT
ncbi:hypothetical protein HMPREF0972_00655 [Actinomyces sp. oral taxon 848 str. F0332]|nr:hypothetical protein HMPREF0972_00655 [Actinomyces sp. oral taxon 848 str. F0332]